MIFHKYDYFTSFWNLSDLISLLLNFVVVAGDLIGMDSRDHVTLSSIAVLIMWLKLFYFCRIFVSTAATIRMIIEITYDMKYFLLVFFLAVGGFGNCFMILSRNYGTEEMFTGQTYWRSFIYSYRQALGDFDTEAYTGEDKYYLFALWFLSTMMLLIIFLNLLIAIMGDTFARVQETIENNMLKELAGIMTENEMLINREKVFGDAKYIIVIQSEKAEEMSGGWEGRLKTLKTYMDKSVIEQNGLLKLLGKEIERANREKAERRVKELETNVNKIINSLSEKVDIIQDLLR